MEVYETTILRFLHKLIKVFASCFVRSALGRRRLPSFFPASAFWTVRLPSVDVDCCVRCSNAFACQREHSVPDALPLRLWQRLPVSDGEPMLLMTETTNEIYTSTWRGLPLHTDWLSESAGSQLSPAACEKSWRALEYKAPLSSIGANFLQLSP